MEPTEVFSVIESLPRGWNIWQAFDGSVCIQLSDGNYRETLQGATFSEAIGKAAGFKLLPRVRRRPDKFTAADWEVVKYGKKWTARHRVSGRELGCHLPTKQACEATLSRWEENAADRIREWDEAFSKAFPNGGTEGVDFRWQ